MSVQMHQFSISIWEKTINLLKKDQRNKQNSTDTGKMLDLLNLMYRFLTIPINIPGSYRVYWKSNFTIYMKWKKTPRIANAIMKEMKKVGEVTLPDLKTYYKSIIIKSVWYWQKNKQIDRWNRIEPEIGPHKYSQHIFQPVFLIFGHYNSVLYVTEILITFLNYQWCWECFMQRFSICIYLSMKSSLKHLFQFYWMVIFFI